MTSTDWRTSWLRANILPHEEARARGLAVKSKAWSSPEFEIRKDLAINAAMPPTYPKLRRGIGMLELLQGLRDWLDLLGNPTYVLTHAWLGGTSSVGKSHLAESMLYYAREKYGSWQEWLTDPWKHSVRFIDWPLAMNRIEQTWNRSKRQTEEAEYTEEDIWEPIEKAWLIVIDGVDRTKSNKWSAYRADCFYRLLQSREFSGMPTIFTAQEDIEKLGNEIAAGGEARAEDQDAIKARLNRRLGLSVHITGPKYQFKERV